MGSERVGSYEGKSATDTVENALDSLKPRQRQVLGLMAQGFSNKKIADKSSISKRYVEYCINRIFKNLGVSSNDREFDPRVKSVLLYQNNTPALKNPVEGYFGDNEIASLSLRQKEVVSLIGKGYSNKRIAGELNISLKSVGNIINRILGEKIPVDSEIFDPRVVLALMSKTKHEA